MAGELHALQLQPVGLQAGGQGVQLLQAERADVGGAVTIEVEDHAGAQDLRQRQRQRQGHRRGHHHHRRRHGRQHRGRVAAFGQRLRVGQQVLGDLHIGLGVPPLQLHLLMSGMHQLDLGAGGLVLGTAPAGVAAQGIGARPQVGPQALGTGHQRRVKAQWRLACGGRAFKATRQRVGLTQRGLRKRPAVVAGVFVEAHVQPALRLGQVVVAQRAAPCIDRLQPGLHRLVGLLVGVDRPVADALGRGGQRGRGGLRRQRAGWPQGRQRGQCGQHGDGQPAGTVRRGTGLQGACHRWLTYRSRARSRLRLTCGSLPRNRVSSNLKRSRR